MPPKEKKEAGVKAKGKAAAKTATKVTKAVAKATKGKCKFLRLKTPHRLSLCVSLCILTRLTTLF